MAMVQPMNSVNGKTERKYKMRDREKNRQEQNKDNVQKI